MNVQAHPSDMSFFLEATSRVKVVFFAVLVFGGKVILGLYLLLLLLPMISLVCCFVIVSPVSYVGFAWKRSRPDPLKNCVI